MGDMRALAVLLGYAVDLAVGDPRWLPHPVRLMGTYITGTEGLLRRCSRSQRLNGLLLTASLVAGVFFLSWGLVEAADGVHRLLGFAVGAGIIYTTLSVRDLFEESEAVRQALSRGELHEARAALSRIVGRDTGRLGEREIIRATVETIAEGTVDGIIAPLCYAVIGGAALALSYKAVNTLDSMIGYRTERYREFGWAAARLDDVANYLPARISVLCLPLAAWVCGHDALACLRAIRRDGRKGPSPNSGIPQAGMAGALGVQLGGVNWYEGVAMAKPTIGTEGRLPELEHVRAAHGIMFGTSAVALLMGLLILLLL